MYILSFTIGSMFIVLMSFVSRAGWSASIRRLPEIVSSIIPWLALLFIPILLTLMNNGSALYEWNSTEASWSGCYEDWVLEQSILYHQSNHLLCYLVDDCLVVLPIVGKAG